jgi:hypothetical protein
MNDSLRDSAYALNRAGFSRSDIAQRLQIKQYDVQALLRDAKHLARYGATPEESGRRKLGSWMRSALDQFRSVGDSVTMTKAEGGTRQNIHVLGKNRGWKVSVVSVGENWRVTAVEKRPPPQRTA